MTEATLDKNGKWNCNTCGKGKHEYKFQAERCTCYLDKKK